LVDQRSSPVPSSHTPTEAPPRSHSPVSGEFGMYRRIKHSCGSHLWDSLLLQPATLRSVGRPRNVRSCADRGVRCGELAESKALHTSSSRRPQPHIRSRDLEPVMNRNTVCPSHPRSFFLHLMLLALHGSQKAFAAFAGKQEKTRKTEK
jgi:hypothetical protein